VNKERRRQISKDTKDTKIEEWKYFKNLLEEVGERVIWGRLEEERQLEKREIRRVIGKLKVGKAMGWMECRMKRGNMVEKG